MGETTSRRCRRRRTVRVFLAATVAYFVLQTTIN
jgi:hypothetical protein